MITLNYALDTYLSMRRTLGFKLDYDETLLKEFLRFLDDHGAEYITIDLALQWAIQPQNAQPAYWIHRLSIVRLFAQYHSALDHRTEVPPVGLIPGKYHRRAPYIYNDTEISQLIDAAGHLPSPNGLRAATYSTLFGLLAVTGMRIREPISLDLKDVNLKKGILTILHTKFRKSRLVPIHPSTQEVLFKYRKLRDEIFPHTLSQSFFLSEKGLSLTHWSVRSTFVKVSHEIGLRKTGDSYGPRVIDFRHTFAVKTLLKWYKDGFDVECQMPKLSTYLGHKHVNDTYWYISAVPELLNLAMIRLNKVEGGLLK